MAWQFSVIDGFDHYAPADAARKWRVVAGAFTATPGPHHGSAARFTGGGNYVDRDRGGAVRSRGGSCWLRVAGSTWGATGHVVPIQVVNGAGSGADVLQAVWLHADGSVSLRRGTTGGTVLAASAAGALPFDAWVYLEYATALSVTTTGRCDLRLDGTVVASATGLQTTDAVPTATDLRWGNIAADGNAVVLDLDDLCDLYSTRSTPEPGAPAWGGPHAILTLYPVGPGELTGFTPVGATPNWACCAEAVGDGDTTYVTKTAGTTPVDLYRISPYNVATPALPVDFDAPDYQQYDAQLVSLSRHLAGSTGAGSVRYRYRDEGGAEQDVDTPLSTGTAYWYDLAGLDAFRSVFQTLRAGWAGDAGAVFRGSQLAVELWYPVGAPAPAPAPAGGQRWSVAGLP